MQLLMYLASAALVFFATILILRLVVRRDYMRVGRLTLVSSASEWLLALIWAFFSYAYLPTGWSNVQVGLILRTAGWVFILLGVLALVYSMAWLGLRRAHGLEVDILIQSGPYRVTRNPQIVGFSLSMIGFIALWPSGHMLVSLLLYVIFVHLMVLIEEEHLLDRHGETYQRYCERVPRYIGFPKKNHEIPI